MLEWTDMDQESQIKINLLSAGATLGTAGGVISIVLARLSGFSLTDIRNSQYIYTANRRRYTENNVNNLSIIYKPVFMALLLCFV